MESFRGIDDQEKVLGRLILTLLFGAGIYYPFVKSCLFFLYRYKSIFSGTPLLSNMMLFIWLCTNCGCGTMSSDTEVLVGEPFTLVVLYTHDDSRSILNH